MLDSRLGLLRHLSIFDGLCERQLGLIVGVSKKAFFAAGDRIIERNRAGDAAYLILTGTARCVTFPQPEPHEILGPGVLVGELAMFADTVHVMTVETIDRVRALAISREALQHAMELAPGIAQVLSDNLLRRLQELACDLRDLERTLAAITEDGRRNRSAVDLRERKASAPGPDLKRRLV